jgi:hypothetical protein
MKTVLICGVCDKVCSPQRRKAPWQELTLFLSKHHVTVSDLNLVHTYCPECDAAKTKDAATQLQANHKSSAA